MNIYKFVLLAILIFSNTAYGSNLQSKCDSGDIISCSKLGKNYCNGWGGVGKNFQKCVKLYEKACKGNNVWACQNLGVLYENGHGIRRNPSRADELYKKTCYELNRSRGCKLLGDSTSFGSNSIAKNNKKALQHYIRGCKLGNGIDGPVLCFQLGVLYNIGVNEYIGDEIKVTINPKTALEFYGKNCDFGGQWGCDSYAELLDKINSNKSN